MDHLEKELDALEHILTDMNAEPIRLSFSSLRKITNDFSQEIGRGGFGVVYMGDLHNGKVAVKKLSEIYEFSEKQFEDELLCLIRVKHKNIVRFLGYCSDTSKQAIQHHGDYVLAEERQRFLCFDYAPKKSLKEYLKDESYRRDWDTSYQLIEGICNGLHYLHNEKRINHLDLKPENILLDADMVPKITDFGLSRRFGEQSRIITKNILGTPGYIAPEYIDNGEISFKSDIYSLGIVIIKLLRGSNEVSDFDNWHKSLVLDNPQVKRCVEIARLCVDKDQHKRPTIDKIVGFLNGKEIVVKIVLPHVLGPSTSSSNSSSSPEQESLPLPRDEDERKLAIATDRRQAVEERVSQPPPPAAVEKETPENCFGHVVDDQKLEELVRYAGKRKTQEDRARQAWRLMEEGGKKGEASTYVDRLKRMYGNGQSTLCLVYNATGDALRLVAGHDWYGYVDGRVEYPSEIGNGQWAAFLHVHRAGEPSGSVCAVVYRGKKEDGQDRDYLLAWSTPWGFYYRNKAYAETGGVDYFKRRWDEVYDKLINSDYSWNTRFDDCVIEARIDTGDSPKFIATIKAEHGP